MKKYKNESRDHVKMSKTPSNNMFIVKRSIHPRITISMLKIQINFHLYMVS